MHHILIYPQRYLVDSPASSSTAKILFLVCIGGTLCSLFMSQTTNIANVYNYESAVNEIVFAKN